MAALEAKGVEDLRLFVSKAQKVVLGGCLTRSRIYRRACRGPFRSMGFVSVIIASAVFAPGLLLVLL